MNTPSPRLLLLSGGIDSAAVANDLMPELSLFVDYGQRGASAERRAAQAVADELGVEHHSVEVDLSVLGSGLLSSAVVPSGWPSPEWWPYRNQFLVTIAAAWVTNYLPPNSGGRLERVSILTGTVKGDGARHADGTPGFYQALDELLRLQEGGHRVAAPALDLTTEELVVSSGVTDAVLGWTHSCHTAAIPCGDCPGCHKRDRVLDYLGRLR